VDIHQGYTQIFIGYALFSEVTHLLITGQPPSQAGVATLEGHIELLRELITRAGMPFVEIAPAPHGHPIIACLTHDVDHPMLKNHFADHTMAGFLCRGVLGSLADVVRGRKKWSAAVKNWVAAARLPFVYLGFARDPWAAFDRYNDIEGGRHSTYFVITERGRAGLQHDGPAPAKRACRYTLEEIVPQLTRILKSGNEVALHGVDAWCNRAAAERESKRLLALVARYRQTAGSAYRTSGPKMTASDKDEVNNTTNSGACDETRIPGVPGIGVRMHWLYFNAEAPILLDSAGFSYDASIGFNQTVGFRAGSARVYRPLGSQGLLELPLIVMDTALFYPDYLDLSEDEAWEVVTKLVDTTVRYGGAFTVNWHDRSIAPERLWGDFYVRLIQELEKRQAWFATASDAVAWFQKRREAVFDYSWTDEQSVHVIAEAAEDGLPPLSIRIHTPRTRRVAESLQPECPSRFYDVPLKGHMEVDFPL
jgi:hypothetical protein